MIIRRFIKSAETSTTKREIEQLIAGETIRKELRQELTCRDLNQSINNLWSVLFTTGYLTQGGIPDGDIFQIKIPNQEIRNIFTKQVYSWFQETAERDGAVLNAFCEAFKNGNAEEVERRFNDYLWNTISIRDTFVRNDKKDNFYHGILLGLLAYKDNWGVSSNKESGEGYCDILVEIGAERIGIVIEVKYSDSENLAAECAEALNQIERMKYEDLLLNNGMQTILKYGIACRKKHCRVMIG